KLYMHGGTGAYALAIGGLLGIIMMVNVHAIIWPNQKKIIAAVTAAAQGTPAPAEMAQWGRTALLASRVNFMLSIPMLLFMGAGSHFKEDGVRRPVGKPAGKSRSFLVQR